MTIEDSNEEEVKEEEKRKSKKTLEKKQEEDEVKASSSSTPISLSNLTCDHEDQTNLISSLTKLIKKNRKVKSLQRTLMEVTDILNSTLPV